MLHNAYIAIVREIMRFKHAKTKKKKCEVLVECIGG